MANPRSSCSPITTTRTTTPPSAWNRLVQQTRSASEASRAKLTESASPSDRVTPSQTHRVTPVRSAKRRRVAQSPQPRLVTESLEPLFAQPDGEQGFTSTLLQFGKPCPPCSKQGCITACPCLVEEVECVASRQLDNETGPASASPKQLFSYPSIDIDQGVKQNNTRAPTDPSHVHCETPSAMRQDLDYATSDMTYKRADESQLCDVSTDRKKTGNELLRFKRHGLEQKGHHLPEGTLSASRQPPSPAVLLTGVVGLQNGSQNPANKTSHVRKGFLPSKKDEEPIQLITPSSSPRFHRNIRDDGNQSDSTGYHTSAPRPKTKRRLNLHSSSYDVKLSHKKRRSPPKRKDGVQTTLSLAIGSGAGMKECKLCDTVYNPYHSEDVKLHAKRHAGALKRERQSVDILGLSESPLMEY